MLFVVLKSWGSSKCKFAPMQFELIDLQHYVNARKCPQVLMSFLPSHVVFKSSFLA